MTGEDQLKRTIQACRRAGLPVIDEQDCTCNLRGQLVVVARAGGLQVMWPYERGCPIHGLEERDRPARTVRRRAGRSRSQAAREAWATRKAGAP
jgi:hypothetical protein